MSHLAPCPACNRHVDIAESACPFCATALPASFRARPPLIPLRGRLSRAALMAAGATLMGAAACSGNDAISGNDAATDRPAVTKDASEDRGFVAFYGAPFPGAGGASATGGTNGTGGVTGAGGSGGTTTRDAGEDRSVVAIYGAAVPADDVANSKQADPGKTS
ncbi:MAG TPA: hypothetical protein VLA79_18870 [Polyangia bacterium]|jgi:hypothetical protein|nr:hypothetical protein [Polyangia bacterium]